MNLGYKPSKLAEVFTLNFMSLIGLAFTIGVVHNSEKDYT